MRYCSVLTCSSAFETEFFFLSRILHHFTFFCLPGSFSATPTNINNSLVWSLYSRHRLRQCGIMRCSSSKWSSKATHFTQKKSERSWSKSINQWHSSKQINQSMFLDKQVTVHWSKIHQVSFKWRLGLCLSSLNHRMSSPSLFPSTYWYCTQDQNNKRVFAHW